jgi:AcrR family transcriptional regulator
METGKEKSTRKLRSDSIRNKELLLEAATQIFSAGGPQASLEAVAKRAGVGIGTLYRHFPTREALFEAVYRHEIDHLGDLAEELLLEDDCVEALRKWFHANIQLIAAKKGMIEALQLVAHGSSELKAYSFKRMSDSITLLMNRAVLAGKVRDDVHPEDLLRALIGIVYSFGNADWQPSAVRMADIFVNGLRKT